ncbi:MAG: aldehyde dehydrogenase family protein, partial [Steroidobacteraceae bacterium]
MNVQLKYVPSSEFSLWINGKAVAGASTFPVINPATEEVLVECPRADLAQLNQAVAAAKAAFPAWAARSIDERRRLLQRLADTLEAQTDRFAELLTRE